MPTWALESEAQLRSWLGLQLASVPAQAIDLSRPVPLKYTPEVVTLSPHGTVVRIQCNPVSHVQAQKPALGRVPRTLVGFGRVMEGGKGGRNDSSWGTVERKGAEREQAGGGRLNREGQ